MLHLLCKDYQSCHDKIMEILVENGAKITPDIMHMLVTTKNIPEDTSIKLLKLSLTKHTWNPKRSTSTGDTALHLAVKAYRYSIVKFLSKRVCDVNAINKAGKTPLQLTSSFNCCLHLVRKGAVLRSDVVFTILKKNKPEQSVVKLLQTDFSINKKSWDCKDKNSDGDMAIHLACRVDRPDIVRFILHEKQCDPNVKNDAGQTPTQLTDNPLTIEYLIRCGAIASAKIVIKWLENNLQLSADLICALILNNPSWETAGGDAILHYLCKNSCSSCCNKVEIIHCLLSKHRCNPNSKDSCGKTALQLTTDPSIMRVLIEHNGMVNFDIACRLITTKSIPEDTCVKLLKLSINTFSWDSGDETTCGDTALHLACRAERCAVVHLLLSAKQCNPNTKNDTGETPIQLTHNPLIIELLIKSGATASSETVIKWLENKVKLRVDLIRALVCNNSSWKTTDGDALLHYLCKDSCSSCYNKVEIIHCLLSIHGCDPNSKDSSGKTALQLTTDPSIMRVLIKHKGIVNFDIACKLITTNAIPEDKCVELLKLSTNNFSWDSGDETNCGDTALHLACRANRCAMVQLLLSEKQCNPNAKNDTGETPIQLTDNLLIIQFLIRSGATASSETVIKWLKNKVQLRVDLIRALVRNNHSWKTTDGDALLHYLCKDSCNSWRNKEIIHCLLSIHGCDPNSKDSNGRTALQLTTDPSIMRVLIEHKGIVNFDIACKLIITKAIPEDTCVELLKLSMNNSTWDSGDETISGDTALHLASRADRCTVVHFLLFEKKCNPNIQNDAEQTPIQLTTNPRIVKYLMQHSALVSSEEVLRWLSCRQQLRNGTILDLLKALLQSNLNRKTTEGDSVLQLVYKSDCCDEIKIICWLISNYHTHIKDMDSWTFNSYLKILKTLTECRKISVEECVLNTVTTTDLHDSTAQIKLLQLFLEQFSWNPDCSLNNDGDTALHLACRADQHSIACYLLFRTKCDLFSRNKHGSIPFVFASSPYMVKMYAIRNVSLSSATVCSWLVNQTRNHHKTSTQMIELLTALTGDYPNWMTTDGDTILHLVSDECNTNLPVDARHNIIRHLLNHCNPNSLNIDGKTPLQLTSDETVMDMLVSHDAVVTVDVAQKIIMKKCISEETAIALLRHFMDNDSLIVKSSFEDDNLVDYGDTALCLACQANRSKIAHFLLSVHCNPNTKDSNGFTPIQLATDPKLIYDLIDYGTTMNSNVVLKLISTETIPDDTVVSLLKKCSGWKRAEILNPNGDTALHLACKADRPSIVQFLLPHSKFSVKVENKHKQVPFALVSSPEIVKLFIKQKVPLPSAVVSSWLKQIESCCSTEQVVELLTALVEDDPNWKTTDCGDTVLHLACKTNQPAIADFLLLKAHCKPNEVNKAGLTPLQLTENPKLICKLFDCGAAISSNLVPKLTSAKEIPDDTLVKMLETCANISKKDGNTALHNACKADRIMVAHMLLSEKKSDPNSKTKDSQTPLELTKNTEIICKLITHGATGGQSVLPRLIELGGISDSDIRKVISTLIKSCPAWNPNKCLNDNGDTVLHFACKANRISLIENLLFEFCCDPMIKNKRKHIPFVYTSNPRVVEKHIVIDVPISSATVRDWLKMQSRNETSNLKIIELLTALTLKKGWSYCTTDGDTILHIVCNNSTEYNWLPVETCHAIVDHLLHVANCDPNARNGDKKTPLQLTSDAYVMRKLLLKKAELPPDNDGTDVFRVMKNDNNCESDVKELLEVESLSSKLRLLTDEDGNSILHIACMHDMSSITHFLLTEAHCNPNEKNKKKKIPFDVTHNQEIITNLVRYGSTKLPRAIKQESPLKPSANIFVVGNPTSGKSTLITALKMRLPLWASIIKCSKTVTESEVNKNAAGIIPHDFESKQVTVLNVYELAGHKEFHDSRTSLLQHTIQSSPTVTVFILVVNLNDSEANIRHAVLYWVSFLQIECNDDWCMPHLIVVGSHFDCLKSKEYKTNYEEIIDSHCQCKHLNIVYTGFVALDCRCADGNINILRGKLEKICKSLQGQEKIAFNAQCLHKWLFMDPRPFEASVGVNLNSILEKIKCQRESATVQDALYYLPDDLGALYTVCNELSDGGHILFLRNPQEPTKSWIITDKTAILSKFNKSELSAPNLLRTGASSSTGVVSFSKVKCIFPEDDPDMMIGLLSCLEFCWEISDQVFSDLDNIPPDHYYFFPNLTLKEAPDDIWNYDHSFHYHCGWMLQCTDDWQFFNSRFIRSLLLRLVLKYADENDINQQVPAIQRKCSVWKNGIYWGNSHGIEILVAVSNDNKAIYFLMRYQKEPHHFVTSLKLRSEVIKEILGYRKNFCSEVNCCKFYINCSATTKYPIETETKLKFKSEDVIKEAISPSHRDTSLVSSTGETTPLQDLLKVINDPYSRLDKQLIQVLFSETSSKKIITDQFLEAFTRASHSDVELLTKIFTDSKERQDSVTLDRKLHRWRNDCQATYQDLHQKLDEVSIFVTDSESTLLKLVEISRDDKPEDQLIAAKRQEGGTEHLTALTRKPQLRELDCIEGNGKTIKVLINAAADWKSVATRLHFEGHEIQSIERDHHFQTFDACRTVFIEWLGGRGRTPTTWETVIKALEEADLSMVAKDLKDVLDIAS